MAELRSELPVHRDRLDQSPLSLPLCHGGDASLIVVQFRASVLHVAGSTLYRLDGCKRIGAAASCFLCGGFLYGERDVRIFDLGAY